MSPSIQPLFASKIMSYFTTAVTSSLGLFLLGKAALFGAETLNFEPDHVGLYPDGTAAADNVVITNQFKDSHGVSFAVDNDLNGLPDEGATSYRLETHYLVNPENGGTDNGTMAFWNSVPYLGGPTKRDIERAGFEGRLGDYMLTPSNRGDALLITYEAPTAGACGEIWDLDNNRNGDYEQVLVEAIGMDGSVIESILSPAGGPPNITNPYEGGPWVWSFAREDADIDRIRIRSVGTGSKVTAPLAFDNFDHDEAFVGNQPALENAGLTSVETSVFLPAADEWFTVAYEDLFPSRGDYDFNDLVVSYRCRVDLNANGDVVQLSGEAYLRARGAGYVHDWDLRIPLGNTSINGAIRLVTTPPDGSPAYQRIATYTAGDIRVPVIRDSRSYFLADDGLHGDGKANVFAGQKHRNGPHTVWTITMDNPVALSDMPEAPYHPVLMVRNTDEEIDLQTRDPNTNLPFAMLVPADWQHPQETVDTGIAYPDLLRYITSGGSEQQDWYLRPNPQHVYAGHEADWEWNRGATD